MSKPRSDVELATLAPRIAPMPAMGIAEQAAALAELLNDGDIVAGIADEQSASLVADALAAMAPNAVVSFCPGSDALPGDDAPASPTNVGQRVAALRRVRAATEATPRSRIALIASGEALARSYPAPEQFDAAPPTVVLGDAIDLSVLHKTLVEHGYIDDDRVDEPGEIALRGTVMDVFPADAVSPLRIEVGDGNIIGLRRYDPIDQRTVEDVTRHEIGRAAEDRGTGGGVALPDHLPGARLVVSDAADERRRRFLLLAADAASRGRKRAVRDVVTNEAWVAIIAGRTVDQIVRIAPPPPSFVEGRSPMAAFARTVTAARADGMRIALLGSPRDLRFLAPRIATRLGDAPQACRTWVDVAAAGPASLLSLPVMAERGFQRDGVLAVTAADLLGSRAERSGAVMHHDAALLPQTELRIGDTVIHEDHGIARIEGIVNLPDAQGGGDAIRLCYAREAERLVPVAETGRLWRYGSGDDAVTLDGLDGKSWQNRRRGIDEAIAESARALAALAAARADDTAPVLDPPVAAYERFAAGFPFVETPDQRTAIDAVRDDLTSGRPMDRLVVGDVGFGKTEVALRAAAAAALSGKQVAVVAPTTVLARQHLESFRIRFDGTGVVVEGLSRLSTPAERKRVRAGLADGTVGIVVGTGAVAGKGIAYADLALVVIDEEQRFGAADKKRIADLGAGHVLTLTATPIPRTLQAAMVGLRQISVIATPPARRQPVRTRVSPMDDEVLRAALLREVSRGGQSFVVVPRIADMAPLAERLASLVPELELLQAHGKMSADAIDEAMVRFGSGDGDVLLATNIIEAGLDVPRANTMAIVHADRFGLSQLHQLRGRVGRGIRRGQVLLFTDADRQIAPRTLKRLRTLEAFDRLGAGFAISARDLDLRGAGDLVGDAQAGHMKLIGIELYQQLLGDALRTARGEEVERWSPELEAGIAGALPTEWIGDEDLRLSLYARLGRLEDDAAIDAFEAELEDRFGALPEAAATLLLAARARAAMRAAGIARIDAGPGAIALTMRKDAAPPAIDGAVTKNGRLLITERIADPSTRLARVIDLIG